MSYFLFSPPGFLWEISKTHIALTTHAWFFPEKVFHVSYPRGNTNNMSSYFLFFPSGFLWEISKTHIALTTYSWFFPEKVLHVSYPRGNTNNILSYFLLIFPLGFYRSFSDISFYITPYIFSERFLGELSLCRISNIFSHWGF